MKIIGLCGGSGSGKSTVASLLSAESIPVLDADAIYHQLIDGPSDCTTALVNTFGSAILNNAGGIDRKKLASMVFTGSDSEKKRNQLNKISHAFVLAKTKQEMANLEKQGKKIVFFDAPLLFESGFDKECDATVCVVAPLEKRIERLIFRDNLDRNTLEKRIASQISDEDLMEKCTFCIHNDKDVQSMREQLLQIMKRLDI